MSPLAHCVLQSISRRCSTSAASFGGIGVVLLGEPKSDALLSSRGVNTDAAVELSLGESTLESDADSLVNFTSVGRANMETNNTTAVSLVDEHLHIAGTFALAGGLVVVPL